MSYSPKFCWYESSQCSSPRLRRTNWLVWLAGWLCCSIGEGRKKFLWNYYFLFFLRNEKHYFYVHLQCLVCFNHYNLYISLKLFLYAPKLISAERVVSIGNDFASLPTPTLCQCQLKMLSVYCLAMCCTITRYYAAYPFMKYVGCISRTWSVLTYK